MTFKAGVAVTRVTPPLGLWMLGAVRQPTPSVGYEHPLEAGVLVLDSDGRRAALCCLDVLSLDVDDAAKLVARVAEAIGADEAAVLINCQHTHHAPAGGTGRANVGFRPVASPEELELSARYAGYLADTVVSNARL